MNYFIVTGVSKGMGAELARQLLGERHCVIGISRSGNEELNRLADERKYRYRDVRFDLNRVGDIDELANRIFEKISKSDAAKVVLINNAAVVEPLGRIEACTSDDIVAGVQVNLVSPMLLTAQFLARTNGWSADRRVIQISSGSGESPTEGMSVYCSTKAALTMFANCVALEQGDASDRVRVYSVDPGMVDTPMQATARTSEHPMRNFFDEANRGGRLRPPGDAAKRILRQYVHNDLG